MSARPSAFVERLRRELLQRPGFTRLPVCGACGRETEPRNFGREHCKRCELERAEASVYFHGLLDATLADALADEPSPPAEPMFGSAEAERPFLIEDEESI